MADLLNYSVVRLAAASLTVPRWQISGQIVSSVNQSQILQDFTGANAVVFPNILGNLTNNQQDDWVEHIMLDLIQRRFGI